MVFSLGGDNKARKQEVKRAESTLKAVRELVVDEAEKLREKRDDLYLEIRNLNRRGEGICTLVGAWTQDHKLLLAQNREFEKEIKSLRHDLSKSRLRGIDQGPQREIEDMKKYQLQEIQSYVDKLRKRNEIVDELESANSQLTYQVSYLEGCNSQLEDQKGSLEVALHSLRTQHENELKNQRFNLSRAHATDLDSLRATNNAEKTALKNQLLRDHRAARSELERKVETFEDSRKREIDSLRGDYESDLDRLRRHYESEIDGLNAKGQEMQRNYKAELDQTREQHISKVEQINQDHMYDRSQLVSAMTEMKKRHDSEKDQMRRNMSQEEIRLKEMFETKLAQLEAAHAAEKSRLRGEIEAYSGALLARDDFKPTPDNEIKGRFLGLAQDVDALARLEWKAGQKEWTDNVLHQLSGNQRLVKKQILQDSLWAVLYENIFCSPFRVLGDEGRSLELKWNEEFGKASDPEERTYAWPAPSIDAERYRYVAIKECRAALEKPTSEWDPRAKLKKGFITSLDTLRKQLTSTIGEFSVLDKSSVDAMEVIIKKAAKMWLDFGMQRCRIRVIVPGSSITTAEEKIQRALGDGLNLILVPQLKRTGNSKGQNLNIEEIVGDCGGELVELSVLS